MRTNFPFFLLSTTFSCLIIWNIPYRTVESFKQHETFVQENMTIVFKEVYNWHKIFDLLVVAMEHNPNVDEVMLFIDNLFIKPIFCPKKLNCNSELNYNYSKFYSFQPPVLVKNGGVCGLDIKPGPPSRTGQKARLFLLPQLYSKDGTQAKEGPRGVIGSSNGIIFDLAGGCSGCTTVVPQVGDEFTIRSHHTGHHLAHVHRIVVAALHSHSETYFHAVSELLPRIHLIMDYIDAHFHNYKQVPREMVFSSRPHYALLNSMNDMMEWGLKSTERGGPHNHWHGTFVQPRHRGAVEASEHIIVGPAVEKLWIPLLRESRRCVVKKLTDYAMHKAKPVCAVGYIPESYILLITRDRDRQRSLLNFTALQTFFDQYFDVPLIIPNLKYGCHLQDNVIYFQKAIGFISSHGAAFTNIIFIRSNATIIQYVPTKPHPFLGPAQSYAQQSRELGHRYIEFQSVSTKEPRWDIHFSLRLFVERVCQPSNPGSKVNSYFLPWKPKEALLNLCSSKEGVESLIHGTPPPPAPS